MYQNHFGFNEKPFNVTPDPRFLYLSEHHQEALASIIYGIRERRGFITLVGEVGTGKTTLLNATLESLDKSTQTAFIFNTDVDFEELLQMVLMEFDLAATGEAVPKFVALDRLNRFATEQFAGGGNVALLIDEAQNLNTRTMENLRLLSNLETQRHKLIQIVLSGQPELDEKLRKNELRQLAQRINMRRYIMPLNETDTYQYILQHLDKAGYKGKHLFDRASLGQIWDFSRGVPRKINLLCDNTLLIAYGLGKKKITKAVVDEAIKDLNWSPYDNGVSDVHHSTPPRKEHVKNLASRQRAFTIAAILLLSLLLGAGSFGILYVQADPFHNLSMKAKEYVAGILGIDHAEGPDASGSKQKTEREASSKSSILGIQDFKSESKPQADTKAEKTGNTETTLAPEAIPELPEHRQIVIEDLPAAQPESAPDDKSDQSPAPAGTIVKAPEPAENSEMMVKKPNAVVISKEKPGIAEEDLLTLPRASSPDTPIAGSKTVRSDGGRKYPISGSSQAGRTVVVRKNDYLARIIRDNYGEKSEKILAMVLQANPQIKNPNLILPGQVIRLPDFEEEKTKDHKKENPEQSHRATPKRAKDQFGFFGFPRR